MEQDITKEKKEWAAQSLYIYEQLYHYVGQYGLMKIDWFDNSEAVRDAYRSKVKIILTAIDEP
jgi:hypothetical protein